MFFYILFFLNLHCNILDYFNLFHFNILNKILLNGIYLLLVIFYQENLMFLYIMDKIYCFVIIWNNLEFLMISHQIIEFFKENFLFNLQLNH